MLKAIYRRVTRRKRIEVPYLEEEEIDLYLAGEIHSNATKAILVLLDQYKQSYKYRAMDPKLSDPETKWYLGGCEAIEDFTQDLQEKMAKVKDNMSE